MRAILTYRKLFSLIAELFSSYELIAIRCGLDEGFAVHLGKSVQHVNLPNTDRRMRRGQAALAQLVDVRNLKSVACSNAASS